MANGDTKTEALLNVLGNGGDASAYQGCCNTKTQNYILDAIDRVQAVEDEVERLENNPDVVDIVATYADLEDYDTSELTDKDVIRVLQDETHNGDSTYYRWDATAQEWTYIGESKQYTDFVGTDGTAAGEAGLVPAPATTDAGKFLKADGTWDDAGGSSITKLTSADYNWPTDNPTSVALWLLPSGVYTAASGTVIRANSSSTIGDVAQGCFVVGYGSGSTEIIRLYAGEGNPKVYLTATSNGAAMTLAGYKGGKIITEGNLAQSTGTSTTDVMSQNATTSMVFADPSTKKKVRIGTDATTPGNESIAIGNYAQTLGGWATSIGPGAYAKGEGVSLGRNTNSDIYAVAIGSGAKAEAQNSIALGSSSLATEKGELNIGTGLQTSWGYNNTNYRLLTGVHDPVDAHDAATKGYVDTAVAGAGGGGAVALTTADYNYPTANPTGVALWLLDAGVYYRENSDVVVYCSNNTSSDRLSDSFTTAIVGAPASSGTRQVILIGGSYPGISGIGKENITRSYFLSSTGSVSSLTNLVGDANIVDSLGSNYTKQPLSAKQGKVLNDKITALEARVAALEGN